MQPSNVDLPAPFGPSTAVTLPDTNSTPMESRMRRPPRSNVNSATRSRESIFM